MSAFTLMTVILLIAKLAGYFPYSWLWVFVPMGVGLVMFVLAMLLLMVAGIIKQ